MTIRPSIAFAAHRDRVRAVVRLHRADNPRVFGSVSRGNDTAGSDLDLLVDAGAGATLFDIVGMEIALEALLGVRVHVMTSGGLQGALRARVLAEAQAV